MPEKTTIRTELTLLIICISLGTIGLVAYAASKFTSGRLVVVITGLGLLGFIATLILLAVRLKRFREIIPAIGISLGSMIIVTYFILFSFVFFFQDAVANKTSSFFQPKAISVEAAQSLTSPGVSAIDLTASDGIHLRGWLVRNSTESQTPLLIYFGGSGSESSEMIPFAQGLDGWSVALINYRGFGLSDGTPTQSNVLADALFIYDHLSIRSDIDSDYVVTMGYSLGTGVAVYLSSQRPVAGTILAAPYDTWTLIGVKQSPLYAPLSGIMKHYFDSIALAPQINNPMLCLTGSNDTAISPALSNRLTGAWGGEVTSIEYPGEDHGLLYHSNNSSADIADFLGEVASK